jgi:hypothetical protein
MKLGPTATNDQDDNERLVRYLECQPGSTDGVQSKKPWFFFWPDAPGSAAEQHALNEGGDSGGDYVDGVHYHAVVIIPPIDKRRWKGTFKGFINRHGWRYLGQYLIRIWPGTVFKTPEKVVSYVAKSWCREHVDYDDVVILPVDKSELPDEMWAKDEPARSLEYRYNWKRDLKSYREEALKRYFELGRELISTQPETDRCQLHERQIV